jgi:hypothetical protein
MRLKDLAIKRAPNIKIQMAGAGGGVIAEVMARF